MSVDYDKLQTLVRVTEDYTNYEPREVSIAADQLKHASLDMARELLHLRNRLKLIRNHCASLAKSARAAGLHVLANEMYASADALTELLGEDKA